MKYKENGQWKDLYLKTSDTLPVGSEIEYNGQTVPDGWEEVTDDVLKSDNIKTTKTLSDTDIYSCNYVNDLKTYSTTEHIVGTWIDGKPIYGRYFTPILISLLTNYWQNLISITGLNIETVVDAVLYGLGNKSILCKQGGAFFQINGNYLQTIGFSEVYQGFSGVYVEYTKTTD